MAAAVLVAASAAFAATPRITVERIPFTVHGFRFAPNERVKVTVIASVRRTVTVKTRATGRFTVVLRDVHAPRCGSFTVRAVGASGDKTFYKSPAVRCG